MQIHYCPNTRFNCKDKIKVGGSRWSLIDVSQTLVQLSSSSYKARNKYSQNLYYNNSSFKNKLIDDFI